MPFVSESQRRKFYAMANRGEISKKKVKEWEDATPDKKLPERVEKKARFGGIERQLDELGLSDAQKALIIGGGGAAMLGSRLLFRPKSKDHEKKAALFEAMGKHAAAVVVNAIGAKGVGKRRTKNETKLLEEAGSDGSDQPKVESNLLAGMKTAQIPTMRGPSSWRKEDVAPYLAPAPNAVAPSVNETVVPAHTRVGLPESVMAAKRPLDEQLAEARYFRRPPSVNSSAREFESGLPTDTLHHLLSRFLNSEAPTQEQPTFTDVPESRTVQRTEGRIGGPVDIRF